MHTGMQQDHPDYRHELLKIIDEKLHSGRTVQNLCACKPGVLAQLCSTGSQILIVSGFEEFVSKMVVQPCGACRVVISVSHEHGMYRGRWPWRGIRSEQVFVKIGQEAGPERLGAVVKRVV